MPLPVPNLDDRRFDDLVAEAEARLRAHLPELTQIAPGDPAHVFIDLFAWLTETILYRANLIPERQRRVFLNLLQIPLRPARPSHGVVCIDGPLQDGALPPPTYPGAVLRNGDVTFTVLDEVQPTPLQLFVAIKERIGVEELAALELSLDDLREQYALPPDAIPEPFQPRSFTPGRDTLSLERSIDKVYYLACAAPTPTAAQRADLPGYRAMHRRSLAGVLINIALAPADEQTGDVVDDLDPRALRWDLISERRVADPTQPDATLTVRRRLQLEEVSDTSLGGRRAGIVRLRLPSNVELFDDLTAEDPMAIGLGDMPPEIAALEGQDRILFWLALSTVDDEPFDLGYLGINGTGVVGQGTVRDRMVGVGNGQPDQVIDLGARDIDPDTLVLVVEGDTEAETWTRVETSLGRGDAPVFRLDAAAGHCVFGNGLETGARLPARHAVRASFRHGGGAATNVAAGAIKEVSEGGGAYAVRHEWPCRGGREAETVEEAERRIPQFLTHRNRAVTRADFIALTETNPVNPVARAEVLEGFLPGNTVQAAREDVPGVVSVFVIPPGDVGRGQTPKPTRRLLKDVFGYLLDRVLIGTELYVLSPEFIPLAVGVNVRLRDPATEAATLNRVRAALTGFLWPLQPGGIEQRGWPMGEDVRANELVTQVARVEGVRAVNRLSLFRQEGGAWVRMAADAALALAPYQLPELMALEVGTGSGEAPLPDSGGRPPPDRPVVPAPVIPERC